MKKRIAGENTAPTAEHCTSKRVTDGPGELVRDAANATLGVTQDVHQPPIPVQIETRPAAPVATTRKGLHTGATLSLVGREDGVGNGNGTALVVDGAPGRGATSDERINGRDASHDATNRSVVGEDTVRDVDRSARIENCAAKARPTVHAGRSIRALVPAVGQLDVKQFERRAGANVEQAHRIVAADDHTVSSGVDHGVFCDVDRFGEDDCAVTSERY